MGSDRLRGWFFLTFALLVLIVQWAANTVAIRTVKEECREERCDQERIRFENEVRTMGRAVTSDWAWPTGEMADPVLPADLARSFTQGKEPYAGRLVMVPLISYQWDGGNRVLWWAGGRMAPPAIEFRGVAEKPTGPIWAVGRVSGVVRDGIRRETPGVDYLVIVEDCHTIPMEMR